MPDQRSFMVIERNGPVVGVIHAIDDASTADLAHPTVAASSTVFAVAHRSAADVSVVRFDIDGNELDDRSVTPVST